MEGESQGCVGVRERDGQLDCSYRTSNLNDSNCCNADARGPEWYLGGILSMHAMQLGLNTVAVLRVSTVVLHGVYAGRPSGLFARMDGRCI